MTHLTQEQFAQLELSRNLNSSVEATLNQVRRILASSRFERCQEHSRNILEHIVALHLLEQDKRINERYLANTFFDTHHSPNIVRQTVRMVRVRLRSYYRNEGREDRIRISIPKGGYVPEIRDRRTVIWVMPFDNWTERSDYLYLSETLAADFIHQLRRLSNLEVCTGRSPHPIQPDYFVRAALIGSEDHVKIVFGLLLLPFDTVVLRQLEGARTDLLKFSPQMAKAVVEHIQNYMLRRGTKVRRPSHRLDGLAHKRILPGREEFDQRNADVG